MSSLVVVKHTNQRLDAANLSIVTAALQLAQPVDLLIVGSQCEPVAEQAAQIVGVNTVYCADDPVYAHQLAENVAALVAQLVQEEKYTHVVSIADTFGKNILPRAAALLGVSQLSDVIKIISKDTFVRPIYAGDAWATVQALDAIKLLTVRATAFTAAELDSEQRATVASLSTVIDSPLSECVSIQQQGEQQVDLASAHIVVSGGRGLQNAENFTLIHELAACLGAAVGATRAAVDAGFAPNDLQVGQTGKVVAPELYIAVGISGAVQHTAGMKDSQIIVAINQDAQAPIFEVATYGLVGDLFTLLPELINKIKQR